ncbi:MAG TPA: hypothetical protein PLH94_08915 [Fimbriimonadaceae bacterium]|nr:hypothetical protein [Fimbriimonadaceae bacterium]
MTAHLLAAVLVGPAPVQFEVKLSKQAIKPGESIRAELVAKNTSRQPVVVAKAIWDGAPAAYANASLYRGAVEYRYSGKSSMPMAQVMVSNKVDRNRFVTLKPGESVVVYWTDVDAVYDFGSSKTRGKEDYAKARLTDLAPGRYEFNVEYGFERNQLKKNLDQDWQKVIEFGPGAESLWTSAVEAKYSGKKTFVVR